MSRAQRRIRLPGTAIALIATAALGACEFIGEKALAPQSGSIEIVVQGIPTDGVASVTAFVQDKEASANRIETVVPIGGRAFFDNLGAGFEILAGLTKLATHRCAVLDREADGALFTGDSGTVETRDGETVRIWFDVRCRSGTVALTVSGLPADDSTRVALAVAGDTVRIWARSGTTQVPVVPGNVSIDPTSVRGSDGFLYDAAPSTVSLQTGETVPAVLAFDTTLADQSGVRVSVSGAPDDSVLTFRVYIRTVGSQVYTDSAVMRLPSSHVFAGFPANVDVEVLITGLAAHRCQALVDGVFTTVDSLTQSATTSASGVPASAFIQLRCHTAALDVTVAGLPAGDSAIIDLDGVFSSAQLHVPNGTHRVHLVPYLTRVWPQSVAGSDGMTYSAPADTVPTYSRQTSALTVTYAPVAPGSISGRVTGNGFGVGDATITLSGGASATATSDGTGNYRFSNLAPGTYTLSVTSPFPNIVFPQPTVTVTLFGGQDLVVDFAGSY